MKQIGKWIAFLSAVLMVTPSHGFDYAAAPETSYFSAAMWRDRDVVTINEAGVELSEDTHLKLDELILRGPLYTNGFALTIDALQITFATGGSIRGYRTAAPEGPTRQQGADGPRSTSTGGTGGDGITPDLADPGVAGKQNPSAIVIFAARFKGQVIVDGRGQQGGRGGHGGIGGKGGTGGQGRRAHATCFSWALHDDSSATDGGVGGQGAPGGKGGKGGRGGAPIPVIVTAGEALPADAQVTLAGGSVGEAGLAGDPGAQGDGGPPGGGDSRKCGVWPAEWRSSRGGGQKGTDGPVQNATLGVGVVGDAAPAVNVQVEPLPTFADLQNSAGLVKTDLHELENQRFELVQAWSSFHWARTYLFLTLDTLGELQNSMTAPSASEFLAGDDGSNLLNSMISSVQDNRLKSLIKLWQDNFIAPLNAQSVPAASPLVGAAAAAVETLQLLQQIQMAPSARDALLAQLQRVRSSSSAQLQGALNAALDSCATYNALKLKALPQVLSLTSQYSVPVCEGDPDLRQAANLEAPLALFRKYGPQIPAPLLPAYQRVAQIWQLFANEAFAEGFSVVPVTNGNSLGSDIQSRIPDRHQWQVPGLGVFTGFPQVAHAHSVPELGQRLFYLQQSLKRMLLR